MKPKYVHDTWVHNTRAAEKIVPFLMGVLHPQTVIDVGCGTGTWLKVFSQHGSTIAGIEGPHLDDSMLLIGRETVTIKDLEKPFSLGRRFDLAICLEVAEHLRESTAESFVGSLTALSDVVFFSGAIPYQGGQNHVNEQWQAYWISLFKQFHFEPFDVVRPAFWNDSDIEAWYKQNALIFVKKGHPKAATLAILPTFNNADLVHPDHYLKKARYLEDIQHGRVGIIPAVKLIVKSFIQTVRK